MHLLPKKKKKKKRVTERRRRKEKKKKGKIKPNPITKLEAVTKMKVECISGASHICYAIVFFPWRFALLSFPLPSWRWVEVVVGPWLWSCSQHHFLAQSFSLLDAPSGWVVVFRFPFVSLGCFVLFSA